MRAPARMPEIPISIDRNPADIRRTARRREPVTFGVPLPQGAARDDVTWQLLDADRAYPVQAETLDRWPDGSIRWLLVDSQVDVPEGASAALRLVPGRSPDAASAPRIEIHDSATGVVVDTGAAEFRLRAGGGFPFDGVSVNDRPVLDA